MFLVWSTVYQGLQNVMKGEAKGAQLRDQTDHMLTRVFHSYSIITYNSSRSCRTTEKSSKRVSRDPVLESWTEITSPSQTHFLR
jgi:hypothetical protein